MGGCLSFKSSYIIVICCTFDFVWLHVLSGAEVCWRGSTGKITWKKSIKCGMIGFELWFYCMSFLLEKTLDFSTNELRFPDIK